VQIDTNQIGGLADMRKLPGTFTATWVVDGKPGLSPEKWSSLMYGFFSREALGFGGPDSELVFDGRLRLCLL
jgi:hypothetical protein